jgi:hypothetical protein
MNAQKSPEINNISYLNLEHQNKIIRKLLGRVPSLFLYWHAAYNPPAMNNYQKRKFQKYVKLIDKKLSRNLSLEVEKLTLIGVDPLASPFLLEVFDLANKYKFKEIEIISWGEKLRDGTFLRQLVDKGLKRVVLPLFSLSAGEHDSIRGKKGAFQEVVLAIDNIVKVSTVELFIYAHPFKKNLDSIKAVSWYTGNVLRSLFCVLPPQLNLMTTSFPLATPSYTEIIKYLNSSGILLAGFPLCIAQKISRQLIPASEQIADSVKICLLQDKFVKLKLCHRCRYFNNCSGTFSDYVSIYGEGELSPF